MTFYKIQKPDQIRSRPEFEYCCPCTMESPLHLLRDIQQIEGVGRPKNLHIIIIIIIIIIGKRYVPEKEYIHMISSYITADWSNIE